MELIDLKICAEALEKENREKGSTYKKLVGEIIHIYEIVALDPEAAKFWKNKIYKT